MHQMRISTNEVSSVVLGPKKLEVEKKIVKSVNSRKKNTKSYCTRRIRSNRRKNKRMHGNVGASTLNNEAGIYMYKQW